MNEPNTQNANRPFTLPEHVVEIKFTPEAERQIWGAQRQPPIELHTCYWWGSIPCAAALGAADIGVGHTGPLVGQEPWGHYYFAWGVNWSKVPDGYDGPVARIGPGVYAPILPADQVEPLIELCTR